MSIKGKAYIIGALADAGLAMTDIDGYFCAGDASGGPMSMADYMGLRNLQHLDSTDVGGSSYILHVGHAAQAVAAGKCSVALITLAGKPLTEGAGAPPRAGASVTRPEDAFESPNRVRLTINTPCAPCDTRRNAGGGLS